MSDTEVYQGLLQDPEVRLAFEQEWLLQEFLSQLEDHMKSHDITRSDLARRMGTSPAFVTQAMREGNNLTMHTMVQMAHAAGLRICLALAPLSQMAMPQSTPWLPWNVVYCEHEPANDQRWARLIASEAGAVIEITADGGMQTDDTWCNKEAEALPAAA